MIRGLREQLINFQPGFDACIEMSAEMLQNLWSLSDHVRIAIVLQVCAYLSLWISLPALLFFFLFVLLLVPCLACAAKSVHSVQHMSCVKCRGVQLYESEIR
jgi:hypothetical protein